MPIVTAANYNEYRGTSDTSQDTQITALILIAEDIAQHVLGMSFSTTTLTERYGVRIGTQWIQLRTVPVQSVTSIKQFYGSGASDYNTLSTDSYYVNLTTGIVSLIGAGQPGLIVDSQGYQVDSPVVGQLPQFTGGVDNYEIVYVGGRATIPAGMKGCIYQLLDLMMGNAGANPLMKSESVLDYSYTKGGTDSEVPFVKQVQTIFAPYANGATLI